MQCELLYLDDRIPGFEQSAGCLMAQVMKMQIVYFENATCPRKRSPDGF
jgi:hypothetical protein